MTDPTKLRPLRDNVLVRRLPRMRAADGLIVAPEAWGSGRHPHAFKHERTIDESAMAAPYELEGVVIAVGPGRTTKRGKRVPMRVEVGQHVVFTDDGDDVAGDYVLIGEEHVMGVRDE